jgi:iron(III) transport system permease protein
MLKTTGPQCSIDAGAIVMFVLVLYPYVYLPPDRLFKSIIHYIEASRSLGCTPWQGFLKVALPMARPAIVQWIVTGINGNIK